MANLIEIDEEQPQDFVKVVQTCKPVVVCFEESAFIEGYTNFFFPHHGFLFWHPTKKPSELKNQLIGIVLLKATSADIDEADAESMEEED